MDEPGKKQKLGVAGWIALIVLGSFLAVSIWYAAHAWMALSGVAMSGAGWFFLICGIVVTFAVGAGLMALVFYSSRKNFDR
jgi:amino acid transporter